MFVRNIWLHFERGVSVTTHNHLLGLLEPLLVTKNPHKKCARLECILALGSNPTG